MEIAVFAPEYGEGNEMVSLIQGCAKSADVRLLPMDEPVVRPLSVGLDTAFVLADGLGALLTLEKVRARAPDLPIVLVSHGPDFALEGIRRQVCDYLIWPLNMADVRRSLERARVAQRRCG